MIGGVKYSSATATKRIQFDTTAIPDAAEVPVELFDSVIDNFLQNALNKRRSFPEIQIRTMLLWESGCAISVCDTGNPLSDQLAHQLFNAPVPSLQGFGVGLYQAARQATANGYELVLLSNIRGNVCFALMPAAAQQRATEACPLPPSD